MKKTTSVKTRQPEKKGRKTNRLNLDLLSKAELKVMPMLVQGLHHKKIEENLNIAYETFKTHRKNILSKLKLKNIVQLTQLALENDLVKKIPAKSSLVLIEVNSSQRRKLTQLADKKKISIRKYCENELARHLKSL